MSLPIRENILKIKPYSPGKPMDEVRRELGIEQVIKLASNENPYGPSPRAKSAIELATDSLHLYPDAASFSLIAAISESFEIETSKIVIGNGSDELIHYLGLIFLDKASDEIIVADPSFVRYDSTAQIADCKIVKVPVEKDYRIDLEKIYDAVTENTKMIFLANPNNPTGTIFGKEELQNLLSKLGKQIVVVLDEAYFEYAAHDPTYPNGIDFLKAGQQVVVLRTMSKAYGLAGLRLGFGFASEQIIDAINRVRAPFNTNSIAQAAATCAIKDKEFVSFVAEKNREQMARVESALEKAGGRPIKSLANFILAEFDEPTKWIFDGLLENGVIVRGGHQLGLPNTLRVSIGTEAEVTKFIETLEKVTVGAVTK